MTRTLILIRHAKSDWADPDLPDHDRPLNARGEAAAPLVGKELAKRGLTPDQVLCSSAHRTQQTWAAIAPELAPTPAPDIEDSLYHASPDTMLAALHEATGQCVAMVAHNPGIAALARALIPVQPAHRKFHIYPTGAVLLAHIPGDWAVLEPGQARLIDFFIPRDLPGHP